MSTFGERLRREREMRNISLDDIAATTKVGTRLLRALEDEQFDQLPGGIFNKGYVRQYAKFVGIDEEQAVTDYLQAVHEAVPDMRGNAEQNTSSRFERVGDPSSDLRGSTFPVVPVLIVLALIAGIIGGWRIYRERQLDRRSQTASTPAAAQSNSTVITPAGIPATSAASTPQTVSGTNVNGLRQPTARENAAGTTASKSTANSESGVPFELTVRPKDRAWVSIKSDGQFVVRGIIKPPDVKTIRASGQVVFFTGNAGAVEVSFNGKNVPLSGGENDERVLVFNSHGVLPGAAPQ